MDVEKIDIVIHKTSDEFCTALIDSIQNLEIPDNYEVEVFPVEGDEKFFVYDYVMSNRDSKYKIYIDEKVQLLEKNILQRIVEVFKSDEKIGVIGVSGAINISTHGICPLSAKRCGKVFLAPQKILAEWQNIESDFQEVEAIDGWIMATQYDFSWRHDLFHGANFADSAQCIEFKRNGGYKTVVIKQDTPFVWYSGDDWGIDEVDRNIFLEEYSKDIFPLVTILIPTFNRPDFFKKALESVLEQTYRNIEIIVSDDSTNDETENLIQEYLEKYPKVKYFRHKNFTAKDNWDFLRKYDNPAAKYVNWLMDDDLFYPRKLEFMVEVYRNNPDVSLVASNRDIINAENKLISRPVKNFFEQTGKMLGNLAGRMLFLYDNYIGELTTVLLKKESLRNNDILWLDDGKEDTVLPDVSTWIYLLSKGNLFWINESLSAFRNHPGQDTFSGSTGPKIVMCWARYLKAVLAQKLFFEDERDIRLAFIHWMKILSLKLREAHLSGYSGEEIPMLEEFYISMAKAFRNGYRIELPGTKNSDDNKFLEVANPLRKNSTPLVSVIIPTYNRPRYFKQALESALAQTYENIEIVISDNSTNDETENLVKKYFSKDKRVKYFHHNNFNANDNWNWARHYNNPDAEYVNWLMDDDLFYPEKIAFMVEVFLNNVGISLVTSKRDFIDDSGKKIYKLFNMLGKTSIIPHELAVQLIFKSYQNILLKLNEPDDSYYGEFTADNYIGGLTDVLIRKEFLRDNDLCLLNDEKGFYPLADVSTWVQLLTQGNLCWIDTPLSATRLHPAQAMKINENNAAVAICWAKLIKYCWEKKIFLNMESDVRIAFFNWIDIAASSFNNMHIQNYHGNEVTALEDLNIAMAEALHNGCQINLPPSVQNILKNFRG